MTDVLAVTAEHWDFSGPYPAPRGDWLRCPVCRDPRAIPKNFLFHTGQPGASIPRRCDAGYKCSRCAHVFNFGIVIPEDAWEHYVGAEETRHIPRPEIRELS